MRRSLLITPLAAALLLSVPGCAADDVAPPADESDFSSDQATLLDFEFDVSLVADISLDDGQTIYDQLLYTVGSLNEDRSVGRLDRVELSNVQRRPAGDLVEISYHVKLPVAWGSRTNLPTSYQFSLPKDVGVRGQASFVTAHSHGCAEAGAHDLDATSFWYYYRPGQPGCSIPDAELVKPVATVTRSAQNAPGTYPEYHEVWADNALEVISIFGKYEATGGAYDEGVGAFNKFVRTMKSQLGPGVVTAPANVADAPGPDVKDVTFEATLADGKRVKVTALLVDAITSTWPGFDERYESLTPTADLIVYNGHAGLGQNVRALARKGRWAAGKYQVFFMNGCDTFAYVDGSLAQTRAVFNPDDPAGTKYMEFITNAMPSYFMSMAAATTSVVSGLLDYQHPKTYEEIFRGVDHSEVVLVTGDEDNVFRPGMPIGAR